MVAPILPVRPSEPRSHVQHGKNSKRFHSRKSSHHRIFTPVYIDELFSRDATVHVDGEKTMKSELTTVETSSPGEEEEEKVGGEMAKREWAAVGSSSSSSRMVGDLGEVDLRADMFIARFKDGMKLDVGSSSSGEGEKISGNMTNSEWAAVGSLSSSSSSLRVVEDLGEVDLRAEMFIARFKNGMKLDVGSSSSGEGEKVSGKMEKSEWAAVGSSSSSSSMVAGDLGEVDLRAEMFIARFKDGMKLGVGSSSSGEGEKVSGKMEKSEWAAVGSSSSSSRVVGDLGEVDLWTEMFIASFKDDMKLDVGSSSSGEGEKVSGKMAKSEWAALGSSSSSTRLVGDLGEVDLQAEMFIERFRNGMKLDVGSSSSGEGEKVSGKMAKSEWAAVGSSLSSSSSRVVGDLGEVDLRAEMFIARFKDGMKLDVGSSSSEEGEMVSGKMAKNEWAAMGSSSSSSTRVVGDLEEVDLRAEMFIARVKDGMRLKRPRSFGEYQ